MRVQHNRERHLRGGGTGYTVIGGIALPCFCSNMKLQAIATKMPQELRQDMLFMYVRGAAGGGGGGDHTRGTIMIAFGLLD